MLGVAPSPSAEGKTSERRSVKDVKRKDEERVPFKLQHELQLGAITMVQTDAPSSSNTKPEFAQSQEPAISIVPEPTQQFRVGSKPSPSLASPPTSPNSPRHNSPLSKLYPAFSKDTMASVKHVNPFPVSPHLQTPRDYLPPVAPSESGSSTPKYVPYSSVMSTPPSYFQRFGSPMSSISTSRTAVPTPPLNRHVPGYYPMERASDSVTHTPKSSLLEDPPLDQLMYWYSDRNPSARPLMNQLASALNKNSDRGTGERQAVALEGVADETMSVNPIYSKPLGSHAIPQKPDKFKPLPSPLIQNHISNDSLAEAPLQTAPPPTLNQSPPRELPEFVTSPLGVEGEGAFEKEESGTDEFVPNVWDDPDREGPLTTAEIKKMRRYFNLRCDGTFTFNDLRCLVEKWQLEESFSAQLLSGIDSSDEFVPFEIFLSACWRVLQHKEAQKEVDIAFLNEIQMEEIRGIFHTLDEDNSGTLTFDEIKRAFILFGLEVDDEAVVSAFKKMDQDKSGAVDLDEFMCMIVARMTNPDDVSDGGRDGEVILVRETLSAVTLGHVATQLREVYETYLPKRDNALTEQQATKALESVGVPVGPRTFEDAEGVGNFNQSSPRRAVGSTGVNFTQFCGRVLRWLLTPKEMGGAVMTPQEMDDMKGVFDMFDEEHTGSLTLQNMVHALEKLEIDSFTEEDVRSMLEKIGKDADDGITFTDFCSLITGDDFGATFVPPQLSDGGRRSSLHHRRASSPASPKPTVVKPHVDRVVPPSGPHTGGFSCVVIGSNLLPHVQEGRKVARTIWFGSTQARVQQWLADNALLVKVPTYPKSLSSELDVTVSVKLVEPADSDEAAKKKGGPPSSKHDPDKGTASFKYLPKKTEPKLHRKDSSSQMEDSEGQLNRWLVVKPASSPRSS